MDSYQDLIPLINEELPTNTREAYMWETKTSINLEDYNRLKKENTNLKSYVEKLEELINSNSLMALYLKDIQNDFSKNSGK